MVCPLVRFWVGVIYSFVFYMSLLAFNVPFFTSGLSYIMYLKSMLYFCGLVHQFRGWVQLSATRSVLSVGLPARVPRRLPVRL
jgi:hypothetical protein